MVPGHPFNEFEPNSGAAAAELGESTQIIAKRCCGGNKQPFAKPPRFHRRNDNRARRSWSDCGVLVIEQTREPLPHIARFVEMIGHARCAPAHGECKTALFGYEGDH